MADDGGNGAIPSPRILKMKNLLDSFEATDQPETCRKCGVRTEVEKIFPSYEIHVCPACQYRYRLWIEEEEVEEEEEIDRVPSKKSPDFWK